MSSLFISCRGIAFGILLAVGGLAISFGYAYGGLALSARELTRHFFWLPNSVEELQLKFIIQSTICL